MHEFSTRASAEMRELIEASGTDVPSVAIRAAQEAAAICEDKVRYGLPLDEAPYFHCGLVAEEGTTIDEMVFRCKLAICLGKQACDPIPRRQAVMAVRRIMDHFYTEKWAADSREATERRDQQPE
jgi:hypothetical protein